MFSIALTSSFCSVLTICSPKNRHLLAKLHKTTRHHLSSSSSGFIYVPGKSPEDHKSVDNVLTGLSYNQDLTVKVSSCQQLVQTFIDRLKLNDTTASLLGELATCTVMMSSSMKSGETIQVQFLGGSGLRSLLVTADSNLQVRGLVINPQAANEIPAVNDDSNTETNIMTSLFGSDGQIQVVRNHPAWKQPMNGIIALREAKVATNLALYLAESEQRTAAIIADICIQEGRCQHALAVMMERLPGCPDESIERAISNLKAVQTKTLASYLRMGAISNGDNDTGPNTAVMDNILDDCLDGLDGSNRGGLRWLKEPGPTFHCPCNEARVWRALRLLPRAEIKDIRREGKGLEMKCEFCGQQYNLSPERLLSDELDK